MIIKTRKLPATSTEGERMRATTDTGYVLTIPYPYSVSDPDDYVARMLAGAMMLGVAPRVERLTGNTFQAT